MRVYFLVLVFVGLTGSIVQAQDSQSPLGKIRGTVVNELGVSVAAAKVNAHLVDGKPRGALVRYVETDKDGRFVVDRLEWGSYKIFAMKESDGYPNTSFSIYSNRLRFSATLSPESSTAEVLVVVGPKAGEITGTISDAVSGKPLHATFRLWLRENPGEFIGMSVSPEFRVLVPPAAEIEFEVTVPGYQPQRYSIDPSTSARHFALKPGEKRALNIALSPNPQ